MRRVKEGTGRSMSFTKEDAEAQVRQLLKEKRWDKALLVCRRVADELHVDPQRLVWVLKHVKLDAEQLRVEDTGSSLSLLQSSRRERAPAELLEGGLHDSVRPGSSRGHGAGLRDDVGCGGGWMHGGIRVDCLGL